MSGFFATLSQMYACYEFYISGYFYNREILLISTQSVFVHSKVLGENCISSEWGLFIQMYRQCCICSTNLFIFDPYLPYDSKCFVWLWDIFQSLLIWLGFFTDFWAFLENNVITSPTEKSDLLLCARLIYHYVLPHDCNMLRWGFHLFTTYFFQHSLRMQTKEINSSIQFSPLFNTHCCGSLIPTFTQVGVPRHYLLNSPTVKGSINCLYFLTGNPFRRLNFCMLAGVRKLWEICIVCGLDDIQKYFFLS